jgi:hypothetical protein
MRIIHHPDLETELGGNLRVDLSEADIVVDNQ